MEKLYRNTEKPDPKPGSVSSGCMSLYGSRGVGAQQSRDTSACQCRDVGTSLCRGVSGHQSLENLRQWFQTMHLFLIQWFLMGQLTLMQWFLMRQCSNKERFLKQWLHLCQQNIKKLVKRGAQRFKGVARTTGSRSSFAGSAGRPGGRACFRRSSSCRLQPLMSMACTGFLFLLFAVYGVAPAYSNPDAARPFFGLSSNSEGKDGSLHGLSYNSEDVDGSLHGLSYNSEDVDTDRPQYMEVLQNGPDGYIELAVSREELFPADTFHVEVSALPVERFQYLALQISYDTSRVVFDRLLPGSLLEGQSVFMAQHLPDYSLAASISSTAGAVAGSGTLLRLQFIITERPAAGPLPFNLDDFEITDSELEPLQVSLQETLSASVPAYLIRTAITAPGPVSIARGATETFTFSMKAEGISEQDIMDGELFSADLGLVSSEQLGPDPLAQSPEQWPDQTWSDLEYTGLSEEGEFLFEGVLPADLETGDWYVAGRFEWAERAWMYAGFGSEGGGIWDGENFTAAHVTVTPPRVTLAFWSFDNESFDPQTGLFNNLGDSSAASFELLGARFNGWTGVGSGRAPNSSNWHPETGPNGQAVEKYWLSSLSTTGYDAFQVHFSMSGSGTGPRDFALQYRIAEDPFEQDPQFFQEQSWSDWQEVPGGRFEVSVSWQTYRIDLPEEAIDAGWLQLRWMVDSPVSINEGNISSAGTNRIDRVHITGVPSDETTLMVWPGDTDRSGSVSESDVMMIGYYWMSTGPLRIPAGPQWSAQPVIRWMPEEAGFADTNGDGLIDHRDIMAIGRNFGQFVPQKSRVAPGPVLSQALPVLQAGDTLHLFLAGREDIDLLGLSTRMEITGLPDHNALAGALAPGNWAGDWQAAERLLIFERQTLPAYPRDPAKALYSEDIATSEIPGLAYSWVHKGRAEAVTADTLARLTLVARRQIDPPARLHLMSATTLDPSGNPHALSPERLHLLMRHSGAEPATEPSAEGPERTLLYPNYPNPFNPGTTIVFDLAQSGQVRLTVYDALGRKVQVLLDQYHEPGRYRMGWQAGDLPSGIYFYRLQAPETEQVRRMMLIR